MCSNPKKPQRKPNPKALEVLVQILMMHHLILISLKPLKSVYFDDSIGYNHKIPLVS